MAGRSDFNTSAFPRSIKRMLSLSPTSNVHQQGVERRMFIEAHRVHKAFKNKRQQFDTAVAEAQPLATAGQLESINPPEPKRDE